MASAASGWNEAEPAFDLGEGYLDLDIAGDRRALGKDLGALALAKLSRKIAELKTVAAMFTPARIGAARAASSRPQKQARRPLASGLKGRCSMKIGAPARPSQKPPSAIDRHRPAAGPVEMAPAQPPSAQPYLISVGLFCGGGGGGVALFGCGATARTTRGAGRGGRP